MIFSDSWGRKNLFLPPTQKIFIFVLMYGPLTAAYILPKNPKIDISAFYDLISSFSTPGMGLNHFLMRGIDSGDDFRYPMHFYEIFWRFMVSEGSPRENRPKDPKKAPKKRDFPIK